VDKASEKVPAAAHDSSALVLIMPANGSQIKLDGAGLVMSAVSAHGPKRQFAAVQRYGRCRWNTGRSADEARTAVLDPLHTSPTVSGLRFGLTHFDPERCCLSAVGTGDPALCHRC
jgi:hypothetical protein